MCKFDSLEQSNEFPNDDDAEKDDQNNDIIIEDQATESYECADIEEMNIITHEEEEIVEGLLEKQQDEKSTTCQPRLQTNDDIQGTMVRQMNPKPNFKIGLLLEGTGEEEEELEDRTAIQVKINAFITSETFLFLFPFFC